MNVIEIQHLTKDYGNQKGIFDVSFSVKEGEVFGFLGPNGAGKTTTIRHLMGFSNADHGECYIYGKNCRTSTDDIQSTLGYIPGEISFMDDMTGIGFIKFMANYRGLHSFSKTEELMKRFELDPSGKLKKMSKGMKQKVGIVCAFMHDPYVLILDEPTSGLDPLMQNRFIELILEEKDQGKTILMSSHIFEEVERTCSRVSIIKAGHLVATDMIEALKESKIKKFIVSLKNIEAANNFAKENLTIEQVTDNHVTVIVKNDIKKFIDAMSRYPVTNIDAATQSLEEVFMHYYGGGSK